MTRQETTEMMLMATLFSPWIIGACVAVLILCVKGAILGVKGIAQIVTKTPAGTSQRQD